MNNYNLSRELTCILFPGVVKNDERALQCLGGIRQISNVYSQGAKKRLTLSFQPENPFIKKINAERKETSGILLKVRVKKKKVNNEVKQEVLETTVVGKVSHIYKFEGMCDFQYLPIHQEGDGPMKCVIEQLMPSGVDDVSFLSGPAPKFILPMSFTKVDKPINYCYTDKMYKTNVRHEILSDDEEVHQRRRGDRVKPLIRIDFNLTRALPTEPHEQYLNLKEANKQIHKDYEVVRKLFEERPIWSQNLIKHLTKIKLNHLKVIMPCLAIFFKRGPWRMLWVRYGYDPRKEPGARFYQTLDFRLRHQEAIYSMVMSHEREKRMSDPSQNQIDTIQNKTECTSGVVSEDIEAHVIFRPGMVPVQRQIFYQYCDVKIPEVEAMLAQEPPPGYMCHQKRGWLPPNADTICRDHICRHMKAVLLSTTNVKDLKLEHAGSDDDGSNIEDDDPSQSSMDEASTSNV